MILLSRAEEIILLAIFKLKENAYGVTIRRQVKDDIGVNWSFGVIYKTLKKMCRKGYVLKSEGSPKAERGGRVRYNYSLTPQGITALKEIHSLHNSTWKGVRNEIIPSGEGA